MAMFSASDLSEEQKEQINAWVADGAQLADVQKHLVEDFGFSVTYMDTRFLALDLDLQFISEVEEVVEKEDVAEPAAPLDSADAVPNLNQAVLSAPQEGGFQPVTAAVDTVARPGAMVSGTVSFSDGEKGRWMIDEMGRPSIDPDTPGYQPVESDLVDFQNTLRDLLEGQ
ncbi:hypothetical protein N9165_02400 [Akkermansiaceae bacterium]|nr:hypothetical protein [Akkermansiaceae bacterium]